MLRVRALQKKSKPRLQAVTDWPSKPAAYPRIRRTPEAYEDILEAATRKGYVGHDLEYTARLEPYLSSMACNGVAASTSWSSARQYVAEALRRGVRFAGHAWLTADKPILERELGVSVPLAQAEDTLIFHYLCNADLCKGEPKDGGASRGAGYMDLWTMASMYTDLPQWKRCRGSGCYGPCPEHDSPGYNGVDSVAPYLALPRLHAELKAKGIPESRIVHLKRLALVCDKMQQIGIKINTEDLRKLDAEIKATKDELFNAEWKPKVGKKDQELKTKTLHWNAPFSPRSPKQVVDYFRSVGIALRSASKEDAKIALGHLPGDCSEATREWLQRYHDYKAAGKGLSSWFDEKYIDALGFVHARFIPYAASTGRLASSTPNFQNIPVRGWGRKIRRVVVPRDASLKLLKADCRQLELRMVLWDAGVTEDFGDDAFSWLVAQDEKLFTEATEWSPLGFSPRDVAKRVSHAGSLMEGFTILYADDLVNSRTAEAVRAGALQIHRDWEYHGGVVAFTGVNLAQGLFGNASYSNRKKALAVQTAYFQRFPQIRKWQRKATAEAERGWSLNAGGHYLTPRGSAEDKAKICAANHMQGSAALYVQEGMLRYDAIGEIPIINLHDELVFEVPVEWPDARCYDFMQLMAAESGLLPGFRCPVKVQVGFNWLDMQEIKGN